MSIPELVIALTDRLDAALVRYDLIRNELVSEHPAVWVEDRCAYVCEDSHPQAELYCIDIDGDGCIGDDYTIDEAAVFLATGMQRGE